MEQPRYTIDEETLREVLDSQAEAEAYVENLSASGEAGDAERVAWLRMLGRLNEAETLGRGVLQRQGLPTPKRAAAGVRLAHVLHWKGRFGEADELFASARQLVTDYRHTHGDEQKVQHWAEMMQGFIDQHQGKARFDAGKVEDARVLFERALNARIAAGAPEDQTESSRQSLRVAQQHALR